MCLRDAASRAGCRFSRRFPFPQLFLSSMVGFRKLEMSLFGKPLKFHPHPSCIPRDDERVPSSAWVSLTPRLFARIDSGWGEARKSVFIQELRRTTEMERDWNRTIFNRSARFSAHLAPNEPLLHSFCILQIEFDLCSISLVIPPAWHLASYRMSNTLPRFILTNKSREISRE